MRFIRHTSLMAIVLALVSCSDFQEVELIRFGVDVQEMTITKEGGIYSLIVSSGTKWDVTSMPEWIRLQSINRSGGSPYEWSVSFSAEANEGYNREGLITIKAGSDTAEIRITQDGKKGKYITVESVSVVPSELTMTEGDTQILTATVFPYNASEKTVTWSSSDESVATVSSSGVVTAKAVGAAVITVKTDDKDKAAACRVTVKAKSITVTGVSLNKSSMTLLIGGTEKLTATVTPSNATNKNVTWSSSNTSVATVDSNGSVSGIKVGTAVITVKTEDGAKTATCAVTVNPISVSGVSLNQTSLSMTVGDTQTLTATVTPSNATDKSVTWASSYTSVATVTSSGVITAKAAGSATITVTTNDGGKKATCSVTVKEKTVYVTGVSLDKTSLSMTEGETYPLTATITPSNATNKSVTWSSSSTSIATVSSSGVVTAKSAGNATITVTTVDGGKTGTCFVSVSQASTAEPVAIDLGLSVKWASFNLGASKPEEYGDYYAWGETAPYYISQDPLTWNEGKTGYNWASYKWCIGSSNTLTKYCNSSTYGYNGFTDTKTVIDSEDDAAHVNLGGKWRMPTDAEWTELMQNCTWTWTTRSGVYGRLVTAPNGNSIFLPAAGCYLIYVGSSGLYWSSSLETSDPRYAWYVDFDSGSVYRSSSIRFLGFSVRPVYGERKTSPGGDIEGTEKDPWN